MPCGGSNKGGFWNEKKMMDQCDFCLESYWLPWLEELTKVENNAEDVELQAVFQARDALSKSERDLALAKRLAAGNVVLSARKATKATRTAIAQINAEKYKLNVAAKAKRGIDTPGASNLPDTNVEEAMEKAKVAKMEQEIDSAKLKERTDRWNFRLRKIKERMEKAAKARSASNTSNSEGPSKKVKEPTSNDLQDKPQSDENISPPCSCSGSINFDNDREEAQSDGNNPDYDYIQNTFPPCCCTTSINTNESQNDMDNNRSILRPTMPSIGRRSVATDTNDLIRQADKSVTVDTYVRKKKSDRPVSDCLKRRMLTDRSEFLADAPASVSHKNNQSECTESTRKRHTPVRPLTIGRSLDSRASSVYERKRLRLERSREFTRNDDHICYCILL